MSDRKQEPLGPSNSIADLAEFFDAHSTEDLEWDPVSAKPARRKGELVHVSIRLPRRDMEALKEAANRSGVGCSTLIRMILRREIDRIRRAAP